MAKLSHFLYVVNFQLLVFPIFFILNLTPTESHVKSNNVRTAIFIFGDSHYDAGNSQYWSGSRNDTTATHYPYGETYFKRPSGRLCDGRIIPDFIASFAKLPLLPPYLKPGKHDFTIGTNLASAGAGVLHTTFPKISINLHKQLSYFKKVKHRLEHKLGEDHLEAKNMILSKAVYLFSIGSNDYFSFLVSNTNTSASTQRDYVSEVIGNFTGVIKEIYKLGGRKMAFQNVGPFGCSPVTKATISFPSCQLGGIDVGDRGKNCCEVAMNLARRHNKYLINALKKLDTQLPGFHYSYFDFYNALYDTINNPSKYGFKEGKVACCGIGAYRGVGCGMINGTAKYELCKNPSEYVFFDGAHTTERANWGLARQLWSGCNKVTWPRNLKQLFSLP